MARALLPRESRHTAPGRRLQWSGFDIRYPASRGRAKRMSNPKLHWNVSFASGPLIPTFAREAAEPGGECWNRTTRKAARHAVQRLVPARLWGGLHPDVRAHRDDGDAAARRRGTERAG